jgi:hypothetical protein
MPLRKNNGAGGYIALTLADGKTLFEHHLSFKNIEFGEHVAAQALQAGHHLGFDANMRFELRGITYFAATNIKAMMRAFHLAGNGCTVDITDELKLKSEEEAKELPEYYEAGQEVEGKGVYLGIYRRARDFSATFNIFAAPENHALTFSSPNKDVVSKQYKYSFEKAVQLVSSTSYIGIKGAKNPELINFDGNDNNLGFWHFMPMQIIRDDKKIRERYAQLCNQDKSNLVTNFYIASLETKHEIFYFSPDSQSITGLPESLPGDYMPPIKTEGAVRAVRFENYDLRMLPAL